MANGTVRALEQPKNLTAHAALLVAAKLLSFFFNIAVPLLLVRKLDQATYGSYKQVFLVVLSAMQIVPLGFGSNTYYFFPRMPSRQASVAANSLLHIGVMGVLATMAFTVFPSLLSLLTSNADVVASASWIGLVAGLWMTGYLIEIIPIVNGESWMASLLIVGSQVTRGLLLFSAGVIWGSVPALLAAAALHGLIQVAAVCWYLHTRFPGFHKSFDWAIWKQQVAYMSKIVGPLLVGSLLIDLPSYFVAHRFDAATYAIYATGLFNIPLATILWEGAGMILLRQVTSLDSAGDRAGIIGLSLGASRKLALAMFPMAAVFAVLSAEFIQFMFTRTYAASAPIFVANVLAIPSLIFMTDAISRIYPHKQHHQFAIRAFVLIALGLVMYTIGSRFGILFAAVAATGAIIAERLVLTVYWAWQLGVRRSDLAGLGPIARIGAATLGASGVCYLAKQPMAGWAPIVVLMVAGTVFLLAYLVMLFLARVVTPQELDLLRGYSQRFLRRAPGSKFA